MRQVITGENAGAGTGGLIRSQASVIGIKTLEGGEKENVEL